MQVREYPLETLFSVVYESTDITAEIKDDILSITYTDNEDGKVDDISITLKDETHKWIGPWMPRRGDLIRLQILPLNQIALECGQFQIDEVSASGSPTVLDIRAVSIPLKSRMRRDLKSKAWEKTTLKAISQTMADSAGIKLMYLVEDDPYYEREDQTEESDLLFLHKLAEDEGLSLKVTDSQLVIFEQQMFEEKEPICSFTLGKDLILGWGFSTQSSDLYKSCTCKYRIPKKRKAIAFTYEDPEIEDGSNLKIRKCVANAEEAKRKAKSALRRKNRYQFTGSLSIVGDTRMCAGVTVLLFGFGGYDGKYIVSQAIHSISSGGYTTAVELRRVINGY